MGIAEVVETRGGVDEAVGEQARTEPRELIEVVHHAQVVGLVVAVVGAAVALVQVVAELMDEGADLVAECAGLAGKGA